MNLTEIEEEVYQHPGAAFGMCIVTYLHQLVEAMHLTCLGHRRYNQMKSLGPSTPSEIWQYDKKQYKYFIIYHIVDIPRD